MSFFTEFKTFIARGNVVDLAVAVVIGAAFGRIVTAFTESILMPLIGAIFGSVDFTNYFIRLGPIPEGFSGNPNSFQQLKDAGVPLLGYGDFVTQLVNFLIVAFALFLVVKGMNKLQERRKAVEEVAESAAEEQQLDVLKDILAELRKDTGRKG